MVEGTFDVVIAGNGLVGASLALALGRHGIRTALIDSAETDAASAGLSTADAWDARIYAISPASVRFLSAIGAWQHLRSERVAACTRMEIFGDRDSARLAFDAYEAGVPVLAYMLESRALFEAIEKALAGIQAVTIFRGEQVAATVRQVGNLQVNLSGGRSLQCELLVGADGARSNVRDLARIPARRTDYHELGLVANFATAEAHSGCAFQWFRGDSVLALLPLPGKRVSMVWSAHESEAKRLLGLPAGGLADAVSAATARRLGRLEVITDAKSFPLMRIVVPDPITERVVLVGDAAHVVHPLAGQGVNLGFGDAETLARVILERGALRDSGDSRLLRRYRRARAEPILAMLAMTHRLHALFEMQGALPRLLRNAGLNLTQRVPVVRSILARQAMG